MRHSAAFKNTYLFPVPFVCVWRFLQSKKAASSLILERKAGALYSLIFGRRRRRRRDECLFVRIALKFLNDEIQMGFVLC